ncbi:hypothetical protein SAMN05421827_11864 [Pedobacter terrae]|uniref:Uncharacterized protein n=1 Tax=Pedobacter terrae TaxID=405671 RepID=A0A1G8AAT4_9SPHI|nr:hypothetical protein [Pedobacter terrae]SDH17963.1 hypothetical protein SAMN05421827_11864 [Pedobacter terrae]
MTTTIKPERKLEKLNSFKILNHGLIARIQGGLIEAPVTATTDTSKKDVDSTSQDSQKND